MFRLVNRRLAANRELESLKQEFNQCSLPTEFVYRIVVSCVDEILDRGLNHPFILKNPYPASVVAGMITLMADPERRDLFSLKCMRIDTVAGVMLTALKNLREAIVPREIQDELTSMPTTPTTSNQSINKISTVNSLLNHPSFPSVNKALLMELLNLSLAILNRSSFNRIKPDMLASILGPHIFTTQHATILQHTPQQAYSFGWGVALVNDIKRCSKMFYVLLGGYRREVLGSVEDCFWEYDPGMAMNSGGTPLPAPLSDGSVGHWLGSTATIHVGGLRRASSSSLDIIDNHGTHSSQKNRQEFYQSVPQLLPVPNCSSSASSNNASYLYVPGSAARPSLSRYSMVGNISTTLSESIRAAAAKEANHWNTSKKNSESKGPAALVHLREPRHTNNNRKQYYRSQGIVTTVEQRQQELFQRRFEEKHRTGFDDAAIDNRDSSELGNLFRRYNIQNETVGDMTWRREEKRQEIERMIRDCRGTGLIFETRRSDDAMSRS
ncbi:hypothetical protein BX616_009249 [Lobosporangium transversale]|uniref:Rho-GAP domain-containing protein n=1 Tax=Lobosporangium transversale TaxID=64571 RepID=A0A1Y2GK78_9FUNG|nr:hypothetical protein BCR41DRAFT_397205 [Lobosporangium transversale]KAF9913959.1 hypothetical protein BX616_009249 [Lobosporangium transversale]ORZ13387.1 hypothetical protein BCR41DRAFT_397205 [Lobosporangium transversale]|eukprot:XP_021880468.1 hypothetical protein BCR41DRAFT_397205 [Lobosporangium transversale]